MSETTTALVARKPDEAAIAEGNLVETPLFVLTNKEAKPKNKAGYTKVIPLGTIIVDRKAIERVIKLNASTEYGYPTTFAYRILLALIQVARAGRFESPKVATSRHQLAQMLGIKAPGKQEYDDIENACHAMAAMYITFRGTWYDRTTKSSSQDREGVHLLDGVQFRDERQASLPGLERESESGYVILGRALFESLKAGYFNGVDLDYINALNRSSLAQLLYSYLTKKDSGKVALTLNLKELGIRFNLRKRAPSALYKAFASALDLLSRPIPVGRNAHQRRFLDRWSYDKEKGQVTVYFFRPGEGLGARPEEDPPEALPFDFPLPAK